MQGEAPARLIWVFDGGHTVVAVATLGSGQRQAADSDSKDVRRKILYNMSAVTNRLAVHDPVLRPDFRRNLREQLGLL